MPEGDDTPMRPYILIVAALLLLPTAVIIADAEDGDGALSPRYDVYFNKAGVAMQSVRYVEDVEIPKVDGVQFWVVADYLRHDPDTGFAIVKVSEVWKYWSAHHDLTEDIKLQPVEGPYILVDDLDDGPDLAPVAYGAVGGVLGAILVLIVGVWRGYIAPFKSRQA